jgi:hypothetical protein
MDPRVPGRGASWLCLRRGRFTLRESYLGARWLGGWIGPTATVNGMEKSKISSPTGTRTPTSGLKRCR